MHGYCKYVKKLDENYSKININNLKTNIVTQKCDKIVESLRKREAHTCTIICKHSKIYNYEIFI